MSIQILASAPPVGVDFGDAGGTLTNLGPGSVSVSDTEAPFVAESTVSSGSSANLVGVQFLRSTTGASVNIKRAPPSAPAAAVASVAGKTGAVVLDVTDITDLNARLTAAEAGTADLATVVHDGVLSFPTAVSATSVAGPALFLDGADGYVKLKTADGALTVIGGATPPITPAAYPSRLSAQAVTGGAVLVDSNGYALPPARGFNTHPVPWSSATVALWHALDTRTSKLALHRIIVRPSDIQPSSSAISSGYVANLDAMIANIQANGGYCLLEIHLNVASAIPSWWAAGADDTARLANPSNGQALIEYLANRYGNPSDPLGAGKVTKAVVGININEPPQNTTDANSTTSIQKLWAYERTIFGWARAKAPDWIIFPALAYAQSTPRFDAPGENTAQLDADPTTFDSIGANYVLDCHHYGLLAVQGAGAPPSLAAAGVYQDPLHRGSGFNGQPYNWSNGGPNLGVGSLIRNISDWRRRQQMYNHLRPAITWCETYGVPMLIGELGWPAVVQSYTNQVDAAGSASLGARAWAQDMRYVLGRASPVLVGTQWWDYNETTDTAVDPWAARPGGNWRAEVSELFADGDDLLVHPVIDQTIADGAGQDFADHVVGQGGPAVTLLDRTGLKVASFNAVYGNRSPSADDSIGYYTQTYPGADQIIAADFTRMGTPAAGVSVGICLQMATGAETFYALYHDAATNAWKVAKSVAGTFTDLSGATYTKAIPTGTAGSVNAALVLVGNVLKAYIAHSLRITFTDSSSPLSANRNCGVWAYGNTTDTDGLYVSNVVASITT